MRTVGVDLAAEPRETAVAIIEWFADRATLEYLARDQRDEQIVDLIVNSDRAGIDCPLGWPEPFVDFLVAHRAGDPVAAANRAARRSLAYRTTDLVLMAERGVRPLSVSADLIGHTAMRAAGILSALAKHGCPVDRSGSGVVVEAYPAAALRHWQLHRPRYKGTGGRSVRDELVDELLAATPSLHIDVDKVELCRKSDDALDALICALIARAAGIGKVTMPDSVQARVAATEGWIAVPTCTIAELFGEGG
jgi:predicted nuclease with RNAse H fold